MLVFQGGGVASGCGVTCWLVELASWLRCWRLCACLVWDGQRDWVCTSDAKCRIEA